MDNNDKHVHISSPKGPEDASNIADEYPSPERTPATLSEHVAPIEQQQNEPVEPVAHLDTNQEETHHEVHHDHQHHQHQHEDTDMQTELANQVAAQAIEAAVAAEVRANATASTTPDNQNNDVDMNIAQGDSQSQNETQDHMQSNHIPKNNHNPRQPTFPKSKSTLSYVPHPSSSTTQQHPSGSSSSVPQTPTPKLSEKEQISILREAYAKNPNPGKKELENLAEKTGRPWNKIREYFRQRRNKLRGLEDLENMEEPGRASGWLQVAYRQAPATSSISQLTLYNSYKHRFDPYSITTPLLGGQELIQLACATFPGCEMAKDDSEYVLKGLEGRTKDSEQGQDINQEDWEKGMEGLVEPLRAGSWLLSSFQHQNDPNAPSTLTQTDLYTSYAARFSSLLTNAGQQESNDNTASQEQTNQPATTQEEQDHEDDMRAFEDAGLNSANDNTEQDQQQEELQTNLNADEQHQSIASLALLPESTEQGQETQSPTPIPTPAVVPTTRKKENRLLNPLELINLTRMTFPKCEPIIDSNGRFVIRGLERRIGHLPGSKEREREMFNFALYNENKPGEAFVNLMKRKLGMLVPDQTSPNNGEDGRGIENEKENGIERNIKRIRMDDGTGNGKDSESLERITQNNDLELNQEDKELIKGLKRFRNSKLGEEVRDVCVSQ